MKGLLKKLSICTLSALTAVTMIFPGVAFASPAIEIGDEAVEDVAVATSGTNWSWDGDKTLSLNNYNGGGIDSAVEMVIDLIGKNKVEGTIYVDGNDLTITGDGSLDVVTEDNIAIYVGEGDLNIKDTTVNAVNETDDNPTIGVFNGNVNIENSDVTASGGGYGFAAHSSDPDKSVITIDGSNVKAKGTTSAIQAIVHTNEPDKVTGGKINLINSKILEDGLEVIPISEETDDDYFQVGQTIGTKDGEPAPEVTIVKDVQGGSNNNAIKKNGSPNTGDYANTTMWICLAALALAAGTTTVLRSRKSR